MFSGPWVWKNLNKEKMLNCTFCQNIAKIRDVKMLKPFHYHQKQCINLLSNLRGGSLAPRADKNQKISKKFQKAWK